MFVCILKKIYLYELQAEELPKQSALSSQKISSINTAFRFCLPQTDYSIEIE